MPTSAFKDTRFFQEPIFSPFAFHDYSYKQKSIKNHEKRTKKARQSMPKAPCLHGISTRNISSPLNSNVKPTQETYVSRESRTKAMSVKTFKDTVPSAPSSKGARTGNMQNGSLHWRKIAVKAS